MKGFLVIALFCVVAVVAQHPRHCNAPAEFEAHAFEWDTKMQFMLRGHFVYDSRLERTALYEEVVNGTDDEFYHTIHLFRERRTYRYNLQSKVCTVQALNRPFHRIHIPHNSTFVGDAIVGTNAFANSGVLTTHWEMHSDTDPKFRWYGVFTDRDVGCVPVLDQYSDATIGTVHNRFFDVVLGISDPNIFVPDEACPRPL